MTEVPHEIDMKDIKRKLQEDGLDPAATDEDKMKYIWQLYLQTEASLQTSLSSIEELRKQQMVEMAEVQNYMEHIRTLSNERETLTLEFEAENETLKEHVEKLTEELQGYRNHDEVKEMLMQQGLGDIAVGTTSEQIAYLLVERARLMDELEAEQAKGVVETPEGMLTAPQLWEIVQQERTEFEEELKEQRDSLRTVKEQMRHTHEEEIASMMSENERLQELLDQLQLKHDRLQTQQNILKEKLEIREEEVQDLKQQIEEDAQQPSSAPSVVQMEELIKLQKRVQELTADNTTLKLTVKSVNTDLQESTEKLREQIGQQERTILSLKCERDDLQREVDDLQVSLRESQNHGMNSASDNVQKNTPEDGPSQQNDEIGESLQQSLQKAVEDLRNENRSLSHELSATKLELKKDRDRLGDFERNNKEEDAQAMRNKIRGLEMKVSSLEGDLACSQRELWTKQNEYKKSLCQSPRPSLTSSASLDSSTPLRGLAKLRRSNSFADIDNTSNQSDNQLRDVTMQLQLVSAEKEKLLRELKEVAQLKDELEEELNEKKDQVEELEDNIEQLQEDNKELAEQLQETLGNLEVKQEELDSMTHKHRVANQNAETAQSEVGDLRSEVGLVKSQLTQMTTDTSIAESSHQREVSILREQLNSVKDERNKLQHKLEAVEQEKMHLSQDVTRLENIEQRIEGQLNSEIGRCQDLENQNQKLEEEVKKAWDQFRDISIKSATLTTSNDHLKMELERKTQMYNDLESNLSQQSVEKSSNLQSSHIRAESAERRLESLQKELEDVMVRLTNTEHQLHEASKMKYDLQDREFKVSHLQGDVKLRDEEIGRLKAQLQQERQQRTVTNLNSDELSSQLERLRSRETELQRRNSELQRTLLDVQAKLERMKDQAQNGKGQDNVDGQSFLSEAFSPQQQEIEDLRSQIVHLNEKYEVQLRKYTERKLRTKNKLHQARELYTQEKAKLKSDLDSVTSELAKVKMSLHRESEFKNQLEENYRKMMADKRNLLSQVAEHEEESREHVRSLSMLQVRVRYLEEENSTLQLRIDSLTRQKHNLDRLLKDYQQDRHREAVTILDECAEMNAHLLDEQSNEQHQLRHQQFESHDHEDEEQAVVGSENLISASDNSLLSSQLQHFTHLSSGIGSSLSLNLDGGFQPRSRSSDVHEFIGYDQLSSALPKSGLNTTGPSSLVDCEFYS